MEKEDQELLNRLSPPPKCMHMDNFKIHDTHYECLDCGLIAPKVTRVSMKEFKEMYPSVTEPRTDG